MDRNDYLKRMKARLDEWTAELEQLTAAAKRKTHEGKAALQDEIDGLSQKRDALTQRLEVLRAQADADWQRLTADVDHAWNTLRAATHRLKQKLTQPLRA